LGLPFDTAVDDERAAKMVSEKSNDLFLMACLMPSMDGFVCKPLTRQALLQAMVRWFSADAV
jgi:CheY-like chemotaxis protein